MVLKKKSKPKKFKVLNFGFMKSVKDRWRRPRGIDNKKRVRKRSAGPSPRIGYKNPEALRFLHPSGMREVLVHNVAELLVAGKDVLVRIASVVGGKKRAEIENKARELNLRVINPVAKKESGAKKEVKEKEEKTKHEKPS